MVGFTKITEEKDRMYTGMLLVSSICALQCIVIRVSYHGILPVNHVCTSLTAAVSDTDCACAECAPQPIICDYSYHMICPALGRR
ncbi:hypothetical protein PoB_002582000 [Plakobranchus ocellatus]|uniref:Uncharacterized protein n=1 Tax=Plakobranchus ocellatus TaxID=259542 RepID=A0AAV3ZVW2_9GAST|nr:hypothetical protein PoB_002582000 [Plakobranchus ocellatus]